MSDKSIHPRVYELYDEYCHGQITRRQFMRRAGALAVTGMTGVAMAQALLPRYAEAHTISFTDPRIRPRYVDYPSRGGVAGKMRGYLVAPAGEGPFPPVLVIHENRGLNPHIEDVARRFAAEGFLALAPDALTAAGGYPGNDDQGRTLQRGLDQDKLLIDMQNSALFLRAHELAGARLGVTGFCWGGGVTNQLAATLGKAVTAGVPFYGRGVSAGAAAGIRASLLIHAAENDPRINAAWPEFEAALAANKIDYQRFVYPGTNHGFHNNSTPRFDPDAAALAWQRTVGFFREKLG